MYRLRALLLLLFFCSCLLQSISLPIPIHQFFKVFIGYLISYTYTYTYTYIYNHTCIIGGSCCAVDAFRISFASSLRRIISPTKSDLLTAIPFTYVWTVNYMTKGGKAKQKYFILPVSHLCGDSIEDPTQYYSGI